MRALLTLALTLGRNGIPAALVFLRDWNASNAMLLYLGENVAAVLLVLLAVRLTAPARETIEGRMKTRGESLRTFLLVAVPFTFGAAVFAGFVIAVKTEYVLDARELGSGLAMMFVFQLVGFAMTLRQLRGTTLADAEHVLVSVLGRVFLLAFAVWAGMFLIVLLSGAFFLPFVALKTLVDVWRVRPEALKRTLLRF